jgi:hypothetical protein
LDSKRACVFLAKIADERETRTMRIADLAPLPTFKAILGCAAASLVAGMLLAPPPAQALPRAADACADGERGVSIQRPRAGGPATCSCRSKASGGIVDVECPGSGGTDGGTSTGTKLPIKKPIKPGLTDIDMRKQ